MNADKNRRIRTNTMIIVLQYSEINKIATAARLNNIWLIEVEN